MLANLFPEELKLQIDEQELKESKLHLYCATRRTEAKCPECGSVSSRQNATYCRHPADLPCLGKGVKLHMRVKRFFCDNGQCCRRTFSEQFENLVEYKARRTNRLKVQQLGIGLELGGEAGKRVLTLTKMDMSAPTIIADIRKMPDKEMQTPRVLGLDDWAKRKGQTYGTIIVDLETREPIELLDSREASVVEEWLKDKEGIEIVSRDRSREYKKAVTAALPEVEQVADRFHILKNLRDASELFVREKPICLQAAGNNIVPSTIEEQESPANDVERVEGTEHIVDKQPLSSTTPSVSVNENDELDSPPERLTKAEQAQAASRARKEERYGQVKQRHQAGQSMRTIASELRMSTRTVKRYILADVCPSYTKGTPRPSKLNKFLDLLENRWRQGCTNATQLWRELRDQHGFSGSRGLVARWAAKQRQLLPPDVRYARQQSATIQPKVLREIKPAPWSARQVSWLLFHEKEKLDEDELDALARVLDSDEQTASAYAHIQQFRQMLKTHCVEKLDDWLAQVSGSGMTGLTSFANGVKQDLAEVKNAFTMSWSNGQVEGQVNRLKFLKRQMFGRANFDLLRKRVLYRSAPS